MLYIKFKIQNQDKFVDFSQLFDHLVKVRQPNYYSKEELKEADEEEVDFNTMSSEEVEAYFLADLEDALDENIQTKRYKELIPIYAFQFLEEYIEFEKKQSGVFGFHLEGLFHYLERDFDVDLDDLRNKNSEGIIEFSTGNFPFGGLERFMITLKSFDLIPTECFNGFEVVRISWLSKFESKTLELPNKTKEYLSK